MSNKKENWVRGAKRLPGLFDTVKWRNADGGNIPLRDATPLEHYQRCGANINWHEWLDESPTPEPVEKEDEINIKEKVLEEYKKGNIVVAGMEGLQVMPLDEFIKQPAEGILYDLNRSEVVVLTFINDPKWVNDYAVAATIRALKEIGKDVEEEMKRLYDWLMDENRKPAQTFFTASELRNVAKEIEYRLTHPKRMLDKGETPMSYDAYK